MDSREQDRINKFLDSKGFFIFVWASLTMFSVAVLALIGFVVWGVWQWGQSL